MKSSVIATILAAVSLGGVAVLYVKVDKLSDKINLSRDPTAHTRDLVVREAVNPSDRGTPSAGQPWRAEVARAAEPTASQPPAAEATLEDRISRLERRQEKMQEAASRRVPLSRFHGGRKFARSVDDLAKTLKLTPTQKDRVADAIERGKQQIEDLLKIPDETGKSPHEQRQDRRKKLMEAIKSKDKSGLLAIPGGMLDYRNKQIPGRNATYGEEIDRVKNETRDEVASTLSAEQQKAFEETNIDPLVGGGGMSMSVGVFHTVGDEGPGAVIVEAGATDVTIEPPAADNTRKDDK